jgi:hypothetical protein
VEDAEAVPVPVPVAAVVAAPELAPVGCCTGCWSSLTRTVSPLLSDRKQPLYPSHTATCRRWHFMRLLAHTC